MVRTECQMYGNYLIWHSVRNIYICVFLSDTHTPRFFLSQEKSRTFYLIELLSFHNELFISFGWTDTINMHKIVFLFRSFSLFLSWKCTYSNIVLVGICIFLSYRLHRSNSWKREKETRVPQIIDSHALQHTN